LFDGAAGALETACWPSLSDMANLLLLSRLPRTPRSLNSLALNCFCFTLFIGGD
jgi:hypothetical protein